MVDIVYAYNDVVPNKKTLICWPNLLKETYDCYMDASKCITNRHKTNYIKGNYNNKTELSLNYQIWLICIKLGWCR